LARIRQIAEIHVHMGLTLDWHLGANRIVWSVAAEAIILYGAKGSLQQFLNG
jgi:hypothetical protein